MSRPRTFLGGLTPDEFLARHFQKKPLLVRQGLPGYVSPISPEELAGLALEAEVESRVVRERRGTFQLDRGPFEESFFPGLPATHWTVLVQDLDQHVPEVARLFEHLDFLPSYRLDDIMASYAAPYGSVGPHFDHYDVFLVQVSGRRRWQITEQFDPKNLRSDSDLCILAEFAPQADWVLEPGDLLYLPPSVAHYGVALEPCVTFSLGCRAPSFGEIAAHALRELIDESGEALRYEDPDLTPAARPHELDDAAIARVERLLQERLRVPREQLAKSFASLLTQPKALFARDDDSPLSRSRVKRVLGARNGLTRRKGSRWLICPTSAGASLFVDGVEFPFAAGLRDAADHLCQVRDVERPWVEGQLAQPLAAAFLERLVGQGFLEPRRGRGAP
jgi:50S ribosomal protein L16 3-hydroxylase